MEEFENEFDFDDFDNDEILRKRLQFELEYLKKTEREINKEQFKIYVACCKAMRKIADANDGEVKTDYISQLNGEDEEFNSGIMCGDCFIIVPYLSLYGETFELLKQVFVYSSNFGLNPMRDGRIGISITIPDIFVDKGISI